ncbi:MAG TPA: MerR family transcriptional regulator [Pyrinomonadaceae bacterium]|jgi:DNA-binding transcriptional MerR regulator|nr:MerR family transcriptional regulator [Pyrinomonadaceae bacterium]
MADEEVTIPDKLFFKIGEVCDLVGVQAHVLRYWETEFPMLSPQKNPSGQRSYRKKDVEIALKIKQLLYKEMFTIAGARKKLQSDSREANKAKVASSSGSFTPIVAQDGKAQMLFDIAPPPDPSAAEEISANQREALKHIASQLVELRDMLSSTPSQTA